MYAKLDQLHRDAHSLFLVHALLFMVRAWRYSVTSAGSGIVHGGGEPAAYMYKQHIHTHSCEGSVYLDRLMHLISLNGAV